MQQLITRAKRILFLKTFRIRQFMGQSVRWNDDLYFDSKTAISRPYRYVYYRIPKAANSTIISSLYTFESKLPEEAPIDLRYIKDSYFAKLSEFSQEDLLDIQASWFKFTVVRNPYSRIVSAYQDKITGDVKKQEYVNRFLGRPFNYPISFDQFLYYLEYGGIALNAHWVPQITLIPGGIKNLDYWGKLESLEADFLHISTRIYGQSAPLRFASHKPTGATLSSPLLTEKNRKRIQKLYYSDFELFSYKV